MLKTFNKNYYLSHRGCYSREKMESLIDSNNHESISDFLDWDISLQDKMYFIRNYCELSLKEKQLLSLVCAQVSLKIYELKYPNDKRVSDCIDAIVLFNEGKINTEQLLSALKECHDAYDAAAYAAAYDAAAYAAAYAAADAAADAAAYAYAAAADAYAYAAAAAAYAAAYAAADAADAYAYAAAAAAAADDAAAYAAADAADAYAADAYAADAVHKTNLINALKEFFKNN